MRLHLSLLFSAALLSSCAYEGTIVEKSHQPHPMYLSQGIEGKFTFIVEDKAGVRHRQMVTPEVFERYAIGQYFNDQETGPSGGIDEGKSFKSTVMTASRSTAANPVRYAKKSSPTTAAKKIAARNAAKRMERVAAKVKARRKAVAAAKRKRSKQAKSSVTVAHIAPVTRPTTQAVPAAPVVEIMPPAAPSDADLRVVTVARCR
jgi:hypothetical protein